MSTCCRVVGRTACRNRSPIMGKSGDSLILLSHWSTKLIGTKRWWSCLIDIKSIIFVLDGAGCYGTLCASQSYEKRIGIDADIWITNRTWLNYALAEINAAATTSLTTSVNVMKFEQFRSETLIHDSAHHIFGQGKVCRLLTVRLAMKSGTDPTKTLISKSGLGTRLWQESSLV